MEVAACVASVVGCKDLRRGVEQNLDCEVRPQLIASWREYTGDPDDQVESWFVDGSPLGIKQVPAPRGIFPEYADKDPAADFTTLASELIDGKKTKAAKDRDAQDEVDKMVNRRWIRKFSSKSAAKRYLKGKVVLSELIVIPIPRGSNTKAKSSVKSNGG